MPHAELANHKPGRAGRLQTVAMGANLAKSTGTTGTPIPIPDPRVICAVAVAMGHSYWLVARVGCVL
jgi:hypothetical protein